jgi:hypothetical protein
MNDVEIVRGIAQALAGSPDDYEALLELIGDARIVLLGEASHGTPEFYSERAAITKRMWWNRWNAQAFGTRANCHRHIHSKFETKFRTRCGRARPRGGAATDNPILGPAKVSS